MVNQGQTVDVEFVISGEMPSLYLTLWKDFSDDFEIELIAPNGESTGKLLPNEKNRNIIIESTSIYFFNNTPVPYNEEQENFFLLKKPIEGIWKLRITGRYIVSGNFNIWLPTAEEVRKNYIIQNSKCKYYIDAAFHSKKSNYSWSI